MIMKRKGTHKPTIEDMVELSGIETLHPGGFALTKRTAEVAGLKTGMNVLDVSSGRGTQAIFYAKKFKVNVTGIDLSDEMIQCAKKNAEKARVSNLVQFEQGDSQAIPFSDNSFDAVINECAVGIPDDSNKVIIEMVRVLKPDGAIAIHESTWQEKISFNEKDEFSERYGTTPLTEEEWEEMLRTAGVKEIQKEIEKWSKPEMFWKIRRFLTIIC